MNFTLDINIRRRPRYAGGDYKNCDIIDLFNIDQSHDLSITQVTAVFGKDSYSVINRSYRLSDADYKRHVLIALYGKPVIR